MEEGRDKLAAKGGVTSTASRSRASEIEAESPSVEVEKPKGGMTSSKNQYLEDMAGDWRNAKMYGGKEKLVAKGGVTSTASGSRNPDMKADCWSTDGNRKYKS